jgi:hypothetical protein
VYRQAIKDLCAYGIVTVFDFLDDDQLSNVVSGAFRNCEGRFKPENLASGYAARGRGRGGRLLGAVRSIFSGGAEPMPEDNDQ